jgi:hypothetical protein
MSTNQVSKLIGLASISALLSACDLTETPKVSLLSSDLEIQNKIDLEIQGEERSVIADVMTRLDAEHREYVSYIINNKIYVNKVSLRNDLEITKPLGNSLFQLSSGEIISRPSDSVGQNEGLSSQAIICPTTSGPYRKVATANGVASIQPGTVLQRFAYARADIGPGGLLIGDFAPPVLNKNPQVKEVAYAYLGTSGSMGVAEADVGVAYSPNFNTWAPTVFTGGQFVTSNPPYDKPPVGPPTRYDWGSGVSMEFIVTKDGEASIVYTGSVANSSINKKNPFTVVFPLSGVRKNGSKNLLKRVTAIAQSKAGSSIYVPNTGSNFSLAWTNVRLGLSRTSGLHLWGQYPNDVTNSCVTSNSVQFGGIGGFDEEVFISN